MLYHVLSIGHKMPLWAMQGFQEYAKRLSNNPKLVLTEIPLPKRDEQTPITVYTQKEAQCITAVLKPNSFVIALDKTGVQFSTSQLAKKIAVWQTQRQIIALIIGGPDGLDPTIIQHADVLWSLSDLTFPHPLVRIMVAEQLYRAHSLLSNHPYHRGS